MSDQPLYLKKGLVVGNDVFVVNTSTGRVGIGVTNPAVSIDASDEVDAFGLPSGNTSQRPSGQLGFMRFNTELDTHEGYTNAGWTALGGQTDPAGVNTSIIINDSGAYYGSANLTFDKTISVLYVANTLSAGLKLFLGNSTVNVVANSTTLSVGNSVVNTTSIKVGANTLINATAFSSVLYTGNGVMQNAATYWNVTPNIVMTTDKVVAAGAYQTIADQTTLAWDTATGINFKLTLGADRALTNPLNIIEGRSGMIWVSGAHKLTFTGNCFVFDSNSAPVVNNASGRSTFLNWHCISNANILISMPATGVPI